MSEIILRLRYPLIFVVYSALTLQVNGKYSYVANELIVPYVHKFISPQLYCTIGKCYEICGFQERSLLKSS